MTQLIDASVELRATQLVLTFVVSGPLPETGVATLATSLIASPDGPIDQVGFKILDSRIIGVWSFDLSDGGSQRNYKESPQQLGDKWTLVVPRDAVRSQSGVWRAGLNVDEDDGGQIEGTY